MGVLVAAAGAVLAVLLALIVVASARIRLAPTRQLGWLVTRERTWDTAGRPAALIPDARS